MYPNKGFTLLELVITLLILMSVFLIFLPLGGSFFNRNSLEHRTNIIIQAIKYAKNKSQIDGKAMVLSELAENDGWVHGMQLFIDNTGNYRFGRGDQLLKKWTWDDKITKVEWHGFSSDHYLLFNNAVQNSAVNGYFALKESGKVKSKIILNRLGRVRVEHLS